MIETKYACVDLSKFELLSTTSLGYALEQEECWLRRLIDSSWAHKNTNPDPRI